MKDHFNWKLHHSFCHSQKCHSTSIYVAQSHHNKNRKWWSGNVSLMSFEGWQLPRECFGETVRIDCSWSLWLCEAPFGDSKLFQISLTVLFFLVQMAASSRKEGERIPTPSVPMEKIQMRPKCDFSWSGSCKEIEHPLPKSKLRPWRKVMEFFKVEKQ